MAISVILVHTISCNKESSFKIHEDQDHAEKEMMLGIPIYNDNTEVNAMEGVFDTEVVRGFRFPPLFIY
jgi:hypothetical protein